MEGSSDVPSPAPVDDRQQLLASLRAKALASRAAAAVATSTQEGTQQPEEGEVEETEAHTRGQALVPTQQKGGGGKKRSRRAGKKDRRKKERPEEIAPVMYEYPDMYRMQMMGPIIPHHGNYDPTMHFVADPVLAASQIYGPRAPLTYTPVVSPAVSLLEPPAGILGIYQQANQEEEEEVAAAQEDEEGWDEQERGQSPVHYDGKDDLHEDLDYEHDDEVVAGGTASPPNEPVEAGPYIIDLDALSSYEDEEGGNDGTDPNVVAPSPQSLTAMAIERLHAQIAQREREQLKRKNSLTEAQMLEVEDLAKQTRLKQSKVAAQEELLRQLLVDCKGIQKECEDVLRFVEKEIPERVATQREEIAALQKQLAEAEQRHSQTITQGQEAAARVRGLQETLSAKKSHIRVLYEGVVKGQAQMAEMEERRTSLLQRKRVGGKNSAPSVTQPQIASAASSSPEGLEELLSAAKRRAAISSAAEVKIPWPPISPQQEQELQRALGVVSGTSNTAEFDKLWLRCVREASESFYALAVRLANYPDQYAVKEAREKLPLSGLSDYRSPLVALRSYRVSSNFASTFGEDIWHPTFSNNIAPSTPLCRFEMNGTCTNKECTFLHKRDYEISNGDTLLMDLARYANPAQVEEARGVLQSLADGLRHDADEVSHVWSNVSRTLAKGIVTPALNGPARPDTVTRTSYFTNSNAKAADEAQNQDPSHVDKRARHADPDDDGDYGEESGYIKLLSERTVHEDQRTRPTEDPGAETLANQGPVEAAEWHQQEDAISEEAVAAKIELIVSENPHDVDVWLRLARSQLQPRGSLYHSAVILARALEFNESSAPLWVVYLCVYLSLQDRNSLTEGSGAEVDALFEQALTRCPACVTLWTIWIHQKRTFPQKDALCKRAVLAVAEEQRLHKVKAGVVARDLSSSLVQLLLFHVQLLCDCDMRSVALTVLAEWCEGRTPSVGPHQFVARDHVNLLLIWLSFVVDPEQGANSSMLSWAPYASITEEYVLVSLRSFGGACLDNPLFRRLMDGLQNAEVSAIARGYSMHDFLPLRVNRIRVLLHAGNRTLAVLLFKELQSFCPQDPDVQSLSAVLLVRGEPNPSDARFVAALASMVKALTEGESLKAVQAIPEKAAAQLVFAMSARHAHVARPQGQSSSLLDDWKNVLGIDVSGVDLVLRSDQGGAVPLSAPELVCSFLCLILRAILEGQSVFSMFEDALYFTRSLGPRFQCPVWTCYLAFASGLSHASVFDSLLPRARNDLLFPAVPEPWLARIFPALPLDRSFLDLSCKSWGFYSPRDALGLHNQMLQSLLERLPRLARRRLVAEIAVPQGNVPLAAWCIQVELKETMNDINTQAVLAWVALVGRACKGEAAENARSRWLWILLERMLGRNAKIVKWMLEHGRDALLVPLWTEALHAVKTVNDATSTGMLRDSMMKLFGLDETS